MENTTPQQETLQTTVEPSVPIQPAPAPTSPRANTFPLILGVLGFAMLTGVGGYLIGSRRPVEVVIKESVSSSPSPAIKEEEPTENLKTFKDDLLPVTFQYPSDMKQKVTYDLGTSYNAYMSFNEIELPKGAFDGNLTALDITYFNPYQKVEDAYANTKGFFSKDSLVIKDLTANGMKGTLFSGLGVDYWAGREMEIAVFDRPQSPVIFYFYGDPKDQKFTKKVFEEIISSVQPK
jgi:hypothetical protein